MDMHLQPQQKLSDDVISALGVSLSATKGLYEENYTANHDKASLRRKATSQASLPSSPPNHTD